ncbi:MAG: hypothetical protein IKZ62_08465 [Prevotella sp.]|nr:hypothetical protein [Prevotella sp.]
MKKLFLLTSTIFLLSCGAEQEYSSWPCRFIYDNSIHLDATLSTAMNYSSRGVFCKITTSSTGGVKYYNFVNNDGLSSQQRETALEKEGHYRLGLNEGIIVGFQTLNTEGGNGGFAAYDLQCPNCVRKENNTANPNYPVKMDSKGLATCTKCGKQYDLNNGGLILNGEKGDVGLERYRRASATGPQGTLSVFSE